MENDSTVESKTPIIMTRKKNQATMPVLEHLHFKFAQLHDFCFPKLFQYQQVGIAGNQVIGVAVLCQSEEKIVLRIAANLDSGMDIYEFGIGLQQGNKCFVVRTIDEFSKVRFAVSMCQIVEQFFGHEQAVFPLEKNSGTSMKHRLQQRTDPNICVNDKPIRSAVLHSVLSSPLYKSQLFLPYRATIHRVVRFAGAALLILGSSGHTDPTAFPVRPFRFGSAA